MFLFISLFFLSHNITYYTYTFLFLFSFSPSVKLNRREVFMNHFRILLDCHQLQFLNINFDENIDRATPRCLETRNFGDELGVKDIISFAKIEPLRKLNFWSGSLHIYIHTPSRLSKIEYLESIYIVCQEPWESLGRSPSPRRT